MDRDNRKSHLAPQLSPATQELLRSSDSPTFLNQADDRTLQTPTSGEIPIVGHMVSPRDQYGSVSNRSPTRSSGPTSAFGSLGRAGGPAVHSGLGSRVVVPSSISSIAASATPLPPSNTSTPTASGPRSASKPVFSLPVRPAPPGGPLPPPPMRRETSDDTKKDSRRPGTFAPRANATYGTAYPTSHPTSHPTPPPQ